MDINFSKELDKVKKKIDHDDNQIRYAKSDMMRVNNWIEQNFPDEKEDGKLRLFLKLQKYMAQIITCRGIGIIQKKLQIRNTLSKHHIAQIYSKIKEQDLGEYNKEKKGFMFYRDKKTCQIEYVTEALADLRQYKSMIFPQKVEQLIKGYLQNDETSKKQIELLGKNKKPFLDSVRFYQLSEEKQLMEFMENIFYKMIERELRGILIQYMQITGSFLDEFNCLDVYMELFNKDMEKLGLENSKIIDKEEITKVFDIKYLSQLPIEPLLLLNAFWQNRATKEIERLSKGLFLKDCLQGLQEVTTDDIKNALYRHELVSRINKKLLDGISPSKTKKAKNLQEGREYSEEIVHFDEVGQTFINQYNLYFSVENFEKENAYLKDINSIQTFGNCQNVLYETKNNTQNTMIMLLLNCGTQYNWGYIEEKAGENSIKENKEYILIGIDYPGFVSPLRLHFDRNSLLEYMESVDETPAIPIYVGNGDIQLNNKNLTTKLYIPMKELQEKDIVGKIKTTKENEPNYRYYRHMTNLFSKRYKKVKNQMPNQYIDLITGEQRASRVKKEDQEVVK